MMDSLGFKMRPEFQNKLKSKEYRKKALQLGFTKVLLRKSDFRINVAR